MVDKPVLVAAHAEKIVGFLDDFRGLVVVRAFTVHQLAFGVKPFAAEAVQALVFAVVDVPVVIYFLEDLFDHSHMGGIGRTNEGVVADIEFGPQILEERADVIHVGFGGHPAVFGGLDDFIAMLVRSRQKIGVTVPHGLEAPGNIRHDGGVGMPQVGFGIHIIDWRRDVEGFSHWITFAP